ncbi:MAG: zinc transporter ZntB [Rhodospirillales bacterium]|nr:zinc transporter ZntB [Rhodospirillales bacterium]MDH3790359.1 zinc transporter ZntB [Rhodospirillales bacterium]MDH3910540.1 zinc transporter ZntB [Rhodospirillales bacterium]MDH3918589.1 zinc transporter ZntB [Rhodospirillales bacterium]MDH3967101.1 zinc transporter ZntB [Rhodospirillales bacterium]
MSEQDGLICAVILDGKGGGREIGWPEIESWSADQGILWVHLDRTGTAAQEWLEQRSGIDPVICQTLLQEEVRPRVLTVGEAMLVILRGVNLNPGADPEDMVGVRVWLERDRIVTLRYRRLMAVNDLREALAAKVGPKGPGEFLYRLADGLIDRLGPVVGELDDRVDALEDEVLTAQSGELRAKLGEIRREAIALRRYLAPQRDVMSRLPAEQIGWLEPTHKAYLREIADRTLRYVEDLDSARERAAVTQDELNSRLSDQMNRTMYVLTVVAAILLPPSLITGLFGINVGGMPGVENAWAFVAVVAALLVLAVVEIVLLRRLKWI